MSTSRARFVRLLDWWSVHPLLDWTAGPLVFVLVLVLARPIGEVPAGFLPGVASLGGIAFAAASFSHNSVTSSTAGVLVHYRDKVSAAALRRTWVSVFLGTVSGAVAALLALLISTVDPTLALAVGAGALTMISVLTSRSVYWIYITVYANGLEKVTDTAYVLRLKDRPGE